MIYIIKPPTEVSDHYTSIELPASKSISNRLLIMAAQSDVQPTIYNLANCDDTRVMLDALTKDDEVVDIGAAGTAMRFLTAYYAMQEGKTHIMTGTQRMKQRPIAILVDALRQLGADITYLENDGCPPLLIRGKKLQGGKLVVDGSISSQYISALLMIGPSLQGGLLLSLNGHIASRPYIEMTLSMMRTYGIKADWVGHTSIQVEPGTYHVGTCQVEPDWSAASYWFEYVALSNLKMRKKWPTEVQLPGLVMPPASLQGDSAVKTIFENGLSLVATMSKLNLLYAIGTRNLVDLMRLDFSEIPDVAQTLVVTLCMMNIPFVFNGLESLYIKETDRVHALKTELAKLGYVLHDDGKGVLMWQRGTCTPEKHPVIHTYKDHRMAMSFAFCCMKLGEIRIADPGVVSKSYPTFWDDLRKLGFSIQELEEECPC